MQRRRISPMILSMTGFGKAAAESSYGIVTAEVRTVNSKTLDLTMKLPRELYAFEGELRTLVQKTVKRGKTEMLVVLKCAASDRDPVLVNWETAEAYKRALEEAAGRLEIPFAMDTALLFSLPGVLNAEAKEIPQEELRGMVFSAAEEALAKLQETRKLEGNNLEIELNGILSEIKRSFALIEAGADAVVPAYKEKLAARISALLGAPEVIDQGRLAQEVVFFADRADISEEIARLRSHFLQVDELMKGGKPVGREIDFVVQEMKREINTLGSKANDAAVSAHVLAFKGKLESFREQIQNIE